MSDISPKNLVDAIQKAADLSAEKRNTIDTEEGLMKISREETTNDLQNNKETQGEDRFPDVQIDVAPDGGEVIVGTNEASKEITTAAEGQPNLLEAQQEIKRPESGLESGEPIKLR